MMRLGGTRRGKKLQAAQGLPRAGLTCNSCDKFEPTTLPCPGSTSEHESYVGCDSARSSQHVQDARQLPTMRTIFQQARVSIPGQQLR
mmetsp:Transcript_17390/g.38301  ORF Transcript_17390/g.38301 Transcript_17390/m.38301 type:complete len:88 (-) Transcript_17390:2014-2277(-)